MKAPFCYDLRTQLLEPKRMQEQDPILAAAALHAMELNAKGFTFSVSGTAIAGTRTDADTFTRTSGFWIDEVYIEHGGVTGTFVVGEAVVETTSGASGFVKEITASHIVIRGAITTAAFVGDKLLTGGTSGATCTGDGTISTTYTDLKGYWVFSHASGTVTAGSWMRVTSNTGTTVDVDGTLHATGTGIILCKNAAEARDAISMNVNDALATGFFYEPVADMTIPDTVGFWTTIRASAASADVNITLPDASNVPDNAIIHIMTVDATTNSIDVTSPSAAQTLDGSDISSGFADLDADGDYMTIQKIGSNATWRTIFNGIA